MSAEKKTLYFSSETTTKIKKELESVLKMTQQTMKLMGNMQHKGSTHNLKIKFLIFFIRHNVWLAAQYAALINP